MGHTHDIVCTQVAPVIQRKGELRGSALHTSALLRQNPEAQLGKGRKALKLSAILSLPYIPWTVSSLWAHTGTRGQYKTNLEEEQEERRKFKES